MNEIARRFAKMPSDNPLNIDPQFCDIPPNEIIPRLWIGNFYDGENLELLNALNIDTIINLTGSIRVLFNKKLHLVIGLNQPFLHTLEDAKLAVEEIDKLWHADKTILVHCLSGKDRAPTVVAKYLDQYYDPGGGAAIVRQKRPNSLPHEDWWG